MKRVIPEKRFKEFKDDWSEEYLYMVLDLLKDGTHGTHINVEEGIYLLSAKNIKNGRINIDKTDRKISVDEYNKIHRNFELKDGDILLTVVGSIGEAAVLKINKKEFTFQRSVAYLRPKKEIESEFLYTTVNSNYFQRELKNRQVVSAQPGIYLGDLSEIPIYFPTLKEQQKIGNFFKHLDQMISLEQRKLEKTKALKSAYLTEMFPSEGERVPKRRFAGFTDEWEQTKLSTLTTYKNGRGHEDRQSKSGKYELINLNSISIDGGFKPSGKFIDESNELLVKDDLVMILSDVGYGDLLGRVALIPESNKFVLNQRVALLRPNKNVNPLFLFSYINKHQRYFKFKGAGMSQLNISKNVVEDFQLLIPNLNEQKLIGKLFKTVDDGIVNQQQKLNKLKAMKQAYLEEMFV
ncbi:restriction endonuclease subunit S [Sporosarcina sp. P33]|uniref:restriction endonuclease subunit S n=1 Tax=Sporosarcina sp. P33 TaxID=1930764 RepID=UPI0009C32956|nr:restriction endonuclease subunit S [Sporosarcina sp. P33]ARD47990.1 hypothetical protein SporoP33_06945 [Sporosarcina sp. P33]